MGLGFTSEAIHAARDRGSGSQPSPAPLPAGSYAPEGYNAEDGSWVRNGYTAEDGSWIPSYFYAPDGSWIPNDSHMPATTEVQVADQATANRLVESGQAQRVVEQNDETGEQRTTKAAEAGLDPNEDYPNGIDQDEAVWQLDEMSESMRPPTYAESIASDEAVVAQANQTEDEKIKKREALVRELVSMAGPVPDPPQRLPCSVIVPQRRPRKKDRGFCRAYAPVLADSGISQEVFLQFIEDLDAVNRVRSTNFIS